MTSTYENRIRIRSCGVHIFRNKVLLIQLRSPVTGELIWTPPGGGIAFGESLSEGVKREFLEETGLTVEPEELIHINELIEAPFHALEFFFKVKKVSGELKLGQDPEHHEDEQLIQDLKYFSGRELQDIILKPESLYPLLKDLIS